MINNCCVVRLETIMTLIRNSELWMKPMHFPPPDHDRDFVNTSEFKNLEKKRIKADVRF